MSLDSYNYFPETDDPLLKLLFKLLRASPRERLLLLPPRMGLPKLRLQEGQRSTGTTDSYYPECENCCEGFARSHFGSPSCTKLTMRCPHPHRRHESSGGGLINLFTIMIDEHFSETVLPTVEEDSLLSSKPSFHPSAK